MADGTLIASNTLTLRVLTLAHAGEYSCEAINSVGGGRSPPILVRMKCKCLREFVSLSIIIVLIIIIFVLDSRCPEMQGGLREARGHSRPLRNGVAALRGRLGSQGRRQVLVDVQRDAW